MSLWSAGYIVRTGDGTRLYDPAMQEAVQRAHYAAGFRAVDGFIMPVFVAWLFAPFSLIRFTPSFLLYSVLNIALGAALAGSLATYLSDLPALVRRTFLFLFALSIPTVAVVLFGQVDFIVFGGLFAAYSLLKRERYALAGVALAFILFKPQMLAGVVLMLLIARRWSTLGALAAVAVPLLTIPALVTSPHTLISNVAQVGRYSSSNRELSVNAELMSNWRGFVVSATGDADMRVWLPGTIVIALAALAIGMTIWRRYARGEASFEHAYAVAVIAPLLMTWHLHTQSLILLFLAIAMELPARFEAGGRSHDREAEWRAVTLMLTLYAALFALWFAATIGLAMMVFLVVAVFSRTAFRWPAERAAAAERDLAVAA